MRLTFFIGAGKMSPMYSAPKFQTVTGKKVGSHEGRLRVFLVLLTLLFGPSPALAADGGPFSWQSLSFDGGVAPILSGPISGTIDGTPVPSQSLENLENTGLDFHLRWSSQVAPHLGLRFSVGYMAFAPSMGFHGLSALPLTAGATVPLVDPRYATGGIIPYLAADIGPSFNTLSANSGNAGSVSLTFDVGVGALYPINPSFSVYAEVLPTLIQGPVSSQNVSTGTSVSSGSMWTLPILLGVTYNYGLPSQK